MAVLSRKTCSEVIDLLDARVTRTTIQKLFYDVEIPDQFVVGNNKKELLLNVFRWLERQQDYHRMFSIVKESLSLFTLEEDQRKIRAALLRDGFVGIDGELAADENLATEHKSALEQLVAKHSSKLTTPTLLHHLRQAEEFFREGRWDASVGQARNFVEQLLTDIARYIANDRHESPNFSRPVLIRDYLEAVGFFDQGERKKLVDGVYGYFSEEGAHPGVGEQSVARVSLSILWNFGFYVMEKIETWAP